MPPDYPVFVSIVVDAPPAVVWRALTDPSMIKHYLFGTGVATDWKAGSPITYKGIWEGKPYEDKGTVLDVDPQRLLVSTFWSSLIGAPDLPENYQTVRYELVPEAAATRLTVTQDNNKSQQDADHSASNWSMVLEDLRKLVESTRGP
jgi:uncharacterized protein YndB with AHSA1/START domain